MGSLRSAQLGEMRAATMTPRAASPAHTPTTPETQVATRPLTRSPCIFLNWQFSVWDFFPWSIEKLLVIVACFFASQLFDVAFLLQMVSFPLLFPNYNKYISNLQAPPSLHVKLSQIFTAHTQNLTKRKEANKIWREFCSSTFKRYFQASEFPSLYKSFWTPAKLVRLNMQSSDEAAPCNPKKFIAKSF